MDKREQIERGLGQLWLGDSLKGLLELASRAISAESREAWAFELWAELVDALAKQIAIECEVEHLYSRTNGEPYTRIRGALPGMDIIEGHQGTVGKSVAIILSLEKEGGDVE